MLCGENRKTNTSSKQICRVSGPKPGCQVQPGLSGCVEPDSKLSFLICRLWVIGIYIFLNIVSRSDNYFQNTILPLWVQFLINCFYSDYKIDLTEYLWIVSFYQRIYFSRSIPHNKIAKTEMYQARVMSLKILRRLKFQIENKVSISGISGILIKLQFMRRSMSRQMRLD